MSIFANQRQLDLLTQFAAFIDLVTHPEKFAGSVQEAVQAAAEFRSIVEAKTKIDEVDKYVEGEFQRAEQVREETKKFKDLTLHRLAEQETVLEKRTKDLDGRMTAFEGDVARFRELDKTTKARLEEVEKEKLRLEKLVDQVLAKERALVEREAALQDRMNQMKAVMGV